MQAEVTIENLWWNNSLMSFFFGEQAANTLEQLVDRIGGNRTQEVFDAINAYFDDVEVASQTFHDESIEDIAAMIGIDLPEDDEEDDDDDEESDIAKANGWFYDKEHGFTMADILNLDLRAEFELPEGVDWEYWDELDEEQQLEVEEFIVNSWEKLSDEDKVRIYEREDLKEIQELNRRVNDYLNKL